MTLEISELSLPAIAIQILQSIKELVCHTFDNKKQYPKTSAGNTRHIAASATFVAQTRRYLRPQDLISLRKPATIYDWIFSGRAKNILMAGMFSDS